MFRQSNLVYGKKIGVVVLLLASGISLSAYSADASKDKMQRQCAEIAGGKTADLQDDVMQECTQGRTSEPRASGMEDTEHARIKSCDAQAKAMDESARPRFLRKCYAGKK
jgi:hypothetical protein